MVLDSTILVDVLRDATGKCRDQLARFLRDSDFLLTRFTQLELLKGCRDESDWSQLLLYLDDQDYLEPTAGTWVEAARIFYELRKKGRTIRSTIDCCIAQLAIENGLTVVHNDRDFEAIATVRPLRQVKLNLKAGS